MSAIPVLIVPVLNNPAKLYGMLRSIDTKIDRILVIDNGDVLNHVTAKDSARGNRVDIITPGANLGVAGSWNLGIKCNPFAPHWLIANSDITWPMDSLERFGAAARRDALVLSGGAPPWCAFMLGDQVVSSVGLFDEGIHPAYFEDNDYERRATHAGFPIVYSGIPVAHDNSSTIKQKEYAEANARTFSVNRAYYAAKQYRGDMSAGEWSLRTRRELSWD